MFKFLKEKIKEAVSKFSKEAEKREKPIDEPIEDEKEGDKEGIAKQFSKLKERFIKKDRGSEIKQPAETPIKVTENTSEKIFSEEDNEAKKGVEKNKAKDIQLSKEIKKADAKRDIAAPAKTEAMHAVSRDEKEELIDTKKKKEESSVLRKIADTITMRSISEEKFKEFFWELEVALLENNVAVEVVDKIREDLKSQLVNSKVRIGKTEEIVRKSLANSIEHILDVPGYKFIEKVKTKKPFVIAFVGVNGSGKTTTIAKMVHLLKKEGLSSVIAASDTFRAAAIQQLQEHAERLGVKVIKQDYGSDPAAVAYDAVKYAEAKNIDVVLIDTAGRLHSNTNLMDEMRKIIRVAKPDMKIFIGEAVTGNDCVEQARQFNDAIGIDAIILAKADVDDKGGAAISVSYVTKKPIIFLGTGQDYDSLTEFSSKIVTESLGLLA
ncbi:MAG: signal recognition particle-docking protein FtsY [Candidatus Woesearchaeota archaeon]